jgi:hypothetical protein
MDHGLKTAGWLAGIAATLVLLVLLLSGCGFTPEGTAIEKAVKVGGAQVFDKGLEHAEWFICDAASIGSVRRRYGHTGLAEAYRELCEGSTTDLIAPEPSADAPSPAEGGSAKAGGFGPETEPEGRNGQDNE